MTTAKEIAKKLDTELAKNWLKLDASCLSCDWTLSTEIPVGANAMPLPIMHGLSCDRPAVVAQITEIQQGWVVRVRPLLTIQKSKLDALSQAPPGNREQRRRIQYPGNGI